MTDIESIPAAAEKTYRSQLTLLLLLVLAFTFQWSFKANHPDLYLPQVAIATPIEAAVESVPLSLRRFVAGTLWMRADEYMHFGPTRKLARDFLATFMAGSYAGNTDIIPLIQLALVFYPQFIDGYELLAINLCMFLQRFEEGLRVLQHGIILNKNFPEVHELYGTIGYIRYHVEKYDARYTKNIEVAKRYFEAATQMFSANPGEKRVDVMRPENYHIHLARIYVELGLPQKAVTEWDLSGLDPDSSDLLAIYLAKVRRGETVPRLPEDLPEFALLDKGSPDATESPKQENMYEASSEIKPILDSEGHPRPMANLSGNDDEHEHSDEEEARRHALEAYGPKRDMTVFHRVVAQISVLCLAGMFFWVRRV